VPSAPDATHSPADGQEIDWIPCVTVAAGAISTGDPQVRPAACAAGAEDWAMSRLSRNKIATSETRVPRAKRGWRQSRRAGGRCIAGLTATRPNARLAIARRSTGWVRRKEVSLREFKRPGPVNNRPQQARRPQGVDVLTLPRVTSRRTRPDIRSAPPQNERTHGTVRSLGTSVPRHAPYSRPWDAVNTPEQHDRSKWCLHGVAKRADLSVQRVAENPLNGRWTGLLVYAGRLRGRIYFRGPAVGLRVC
jgi:hypothetical protein